MLARASRRRSPTARKAPPRAPRRRHHTRSRCAVVARPGPEMAHAGIVRCRGRANDRPCIRCRRSTWTTSMSIKWGAWMTSVSSSRRNATRLPAGVLSRSSTAAEASRTISAFLVPHGGRRQVPDPVPGAAHGVWHPAFPVDLVAPATARSATPGTATWRRPPSPPAPSGAGAATQGRCGSGCAACLEHENMKDECQARMRPSDCHHIPHTVIARPSSACSSRRKILSFHGFPSVRSKITRCPDCAAQRSM